MTKEKIFTVYEKPEASDPVDRVVLLREGFSFWALIFNVLWLIANRMWLVLTGYVVVAIALAIACAALQASELATTLVQFWLQVMLAYHAYDLQGWVLRRKKYRMAGVLVAESEMYAMRRYYEFAA